VAELGRPISERLQALARNGRLKRRIGAPDFVHETQILNSQWKLGEKFDLFSGSTMFRYRPQVILYCFKKLLKIHSL
jgi:hypothetical protein